MTTSTNSHSTTTTHHSHNNFWFQCPVALRENILSYNSGVDTLRFACTSRQMTAWLAHEDCNELWKTHLKTDFWEGDRLVQAVERRRQGDDTSSLSFVSLWKQVYQGFLLRHSLPKAAAALQDRAPSRSAAAAAAAAAATASMYNHNHVVVPWTRPSAAQAAEKDVSSLVFLVRLGTCPDSVGLLQWQEDTRHGCDNLKVDQEWYDEWYEQEYKLLELPDLDKQVWSLIEPEEIDSDLEEAPESEREKWGKIVQHFKDTYRLTLHVMDLESGQVLTLLEDSIASDAEDCAGLYPSMLNYANEHELHLWGVPGIASPFYRTVTERDFDRFGYGGGDHDYPKIKGLHFLSELSLGRSFSFDKDSNDSIYMENISISANSDVSTIRSRQQICSYLRTLMRAKCAKVPSPQPILNRTVEDELAPVSIQPVWMQETKILDAIVAFLTFDEQAMNLRLVNQAFKTAAVRAMSFKVLDQTWLPFAFDRYDPVSFVRGDARRGWSTDLDSRTSLVEHTLWQLSCRCTHSCNDKQACPDMQTKTEDFPSFSVDEKTYALDPEEARQQLMTRGQYCPKRDSSASGSKKRRHEDNDFTAEIEFCRLKPGKNLFQLCDRVHRNVKKEVQYHFLPKSLVFHYGISQDLTSKRFLRFMFLVLTDGASTSQGHFPEISVASFQVKFHDCDSCIYSRKKVIYRFHTALNEPVELCLESRHVLDY